jgi:hypothetical protein
LPPTTSILRLAYARVLGDARDQTWPWCAMLLFATSITGCARTSSATGFALRVTPAVEASAVQTAMTPLASAPVFLPSPPEPRTIRIRWHSYDTGRPVDPHDWPLLVVNGVALGRLPDGTVDRALAQRLFRLIDCAEWFAVNFVGAEQALKQFGPGANRGAMLFLTMPSSATVWTPRR